MAVSNGSHSQIFDSEWGSKFLGSGVESQGQPNEAEQRYAFMDNGDEEMKSNQQLKKESEAIEKKEGLIQFAIVETSDNNISIA